MKKFLSIFLALAMLISLIPAVFAADTETGIKVVYDFTDEDVINTSLQTNPDQTITTYQLDPTVFTYDTTNGFWEYAEDSYENSLIQSRVDTGVRLNIDNNSFQVAGNISDMNYWIAFKLYVPKTGTYALTTDVISLSNITTKNYTHVNAYIFTTESVASAGNTIKEKILAGSIEENQVKTNDLAYNNNAAGAKQTLSFGEPMPLSAGEHYFVFVPTAKDGLLSAATMCLLSLTLTEDGTGTGNAIMGGKISGVSDTLEIGDAETVAATGYFSSTGAEISDFTYSVEGNAVEIAGDTVTAKEAGTATIIATSASAVEGCNTITKTVKVEAPEPEEDAEIKAAFSPESTPANDYNEPTVITITKDGSEINSVKNADGTHYIEAPEKNKNDAKFLYWAKGLSTQKRILIGKTNVLTDYVPDSKYANYLIPVYEDEISGVEYYNANGQLIATGTAPSAYPSMAGYGTATGWDKYGDNIYIAHYELAKPEENIVITKEGDYALNKEGNYAYGDTVTCTAAAKDEEGNPFKCWKKNDEIVGTDSTYTFKAWENCTVEAVYETHVPYTGEKMKIIIDDFATGNEIGVMAEFIGLDSAVEKGIMFTDSEENTTKIAMTTKDSQFTVTADKAGTYVGYAILKSGDNAFTLITGGSYSK
ncbi:MAG: hypothetical protein IJN09_02290 [Oscillospiraceae bacterium]|nr:hypothetical protein [Oscillospiraceae bacterium]